MSAKTDPPHRIILLPEALVIFVSDSGGTYRAHLSGTAIRADRTAGPEQAAQACATKAMGDRPYTLKRYGKANVWIIEERPGT